MRALQIDELRLWCREAQSGIQVDSTERLRYSTPNPMGIRVDVPQEALRAVALVATLLSIEEDEGAYYGGLILFRQLDTGTPRIERCGLRILEQMRRAYGVTASVENAPGQLFRTDEIVDVHAFLTLPLLFGWDAYFAPHATRYFAYARRNGSLFLVTDEEQVLRRLTAATEQYRPVPELPTYLPGT
jgi:hypothetical protein